MQVIVFELEDRHYAIKTDTVEEISKLLDITPVPNAPYYIKGLINLRGNVISLIETSKLLNIETTKPYANIIIVNIDNETIGMLVGDVWEVMDIQEDRIELCSTSEEEKKGMVGIIQIQDRIINYIELEECIPS